MEDYQIAPEEKRKGQSISPFKYIFPKVIIFRLSLLGVSSQLPPDNDLGLVCLLRGTRRLV